VSLQRAEIFDEFFIQVTDKDILAYYYQFDLANKKIELRGRISALEEASVKKSTLSDFNFEEYVNLIIPIESESNEKRISFIENHVKLGTFLFDFLFKGRILDFFHEAHQKTCIEKNGYLRIRISVIDAKLANIAWEFLYDKGLGKGKFLSTYSKTPLTRFIGKINDLMKLYDDYDKIKRASGNKIVVLPIAVNAFGDNNIKPEHAIKNLRKYLNVLNSKKDSKIKIIPRSLTVEPTWDNLNSELLTPHERYNIIHFYGHGTYSPDIGSKFLMETLDGSRDEVDAQRFNKLFEGEKSAHIRLILMNACEGAKSSSRDANSGLAYDLISVDSLTRISAVIAMQFPITLPPVEYIWKNLYRNISIGYPSDVAIQITREGLWGSSDFKGRKWFATPVIFMRSVNGYYFDDISATRDVPYSSNVNRNNETLEISSDMPKNKIKKSIETVKKFLESNPDNMTERECWEKTKMATLIDLIVNKSDNYGINYNTKTTLIQSKISINRHLNEQDSKRKSDPSDPSIVALSDTIQTQFHTLIAQIEDIITKQPSSSSDESLLVRSETIIALDELIDKSIDILNLIIDSKDKILECNHSLSNEAFFNHNLSILSNTTLQLDEMHKLYITSIKARFDSLWVQKLSKYDLSSKSHRIYTTSVNTKRDNFLKKDLNKLVNNFLAEFMKSRKSMTLDILDSWRKS
jgi:hypothetical protein